MDFLGYEDRERVYLGTAFDKQNLESMRWLLSKSETMREQIVSYFLPSFPFNHAEVDFLAKMLQEGLLTLTDEEWKEMESCNSRLYEKLHDDV